MMGGHGAGRIFLKWKTAALYEDLLLKTDACGAQLCRSQELGARKTTRGGFEARPFPIVLGVQERAKLARLRGSGL